MFSVERDGKPSHEIGIRRGYDTQQSIDIPLQENCLQCVEHVKRVSDIVETIS